MSKNKDKKQKKQKKHGKHLNAKTADRHLMYQASVQNPEQEVEFVTEYFEEFRGRKPMTFKEDFCGTAFSCAEWVRSDEERTAVGIDLDRPTLDWGKEHNIDPLGDPAERVTLLEQDVLKATKEKFDINVAMNFSYMIFKDRKTLLKYFKAVHKSLADDGMFFLDIYGGYEANQVMEEKRKVEGFVYVWDQESYNPIDSSVVNHIHFHFKKGPPMKKAFTYEWRLWRPVELRELLEEAGFAKIDFHWEEEIDSGEYEVETEVEDQAGWVAFMSAAK